MKKVKGFTMMELIVVMAIIGILAAILVPLLYTYIRQARISRLNTNARDVYGAANYSISDYHAGFNQDLLLPDSIYTGGSDRIAHKDGSNDRCDLTIYLGEHFNGYFAFETGSSGFDIKYALWSESPISVGDVAQLNEQSVETNMVGCYPILP